MPLQPIVQQFLSDLVVHEMQPAIGYARRMVNVTTTVAIPMGRVVWRAKGAASQQAPYALLTAPATQLVADNEFAVVFGDKYSCNYLVPADADGTTACVAFVRDEVILKDDLLLSTNNITRDSAAHQALKQVLEDQGIIIEKTLGA